MKVSIPHRLLVGRFLTRSGDQAWDFAVPLVLLKIFPDQLRIAAFYFFMVRLLSVFILPRVASLIDSMERSRAARLGICIQLGGVLLGAASIIFLASQSSTGINWSVAEPWLAFGALITGGFLSSVGSSFMDIAIANDLVPSTLDENSLTLFNSRLRQVDLFTEVTSPVVAGLLLLIDDPPLAGFLGVAAWNLISFFPELALLNSIFRDRPELNQKTLQVVSSFKTPLLQKITRGWQAFLREPVALVALAYALLWLSVLSPHGVLLTGFLKDGWRLPEWAIGTFRGAGAIFGLFATLLFPVVIRGSGLLRGSQFFLYWQMGTLVVALFFFFLNSVGGQIGFLVCILFSRIGLYGFSLGEMQIRQIGIRAEVRGEVNGFASALTGLATLALYGVGTLLPRTEDFRSLVVGSVVFVWIATVVYSIWATRTKKEHSAFTMPGC